MKFNYLKLILSVIGIGILYSCSEKNQYLPSLLKIDMIMLYSPDSAYKLLSSIKDVDLRSEEEKALFSLLLAQAINKKYIPNINDSLISVIHAYLIAINNKSDDYRTQTLVYDNLAVCYESQNFFQKAQEAYQHSYHINKENKDSIRILYPLRGIANLYALQGNISKAIIYYNQSASIIKKDEKAEWISAIYCDMSRLFLTLNLPSLSEDIYTQTAIYQSLYELKKKQRLFHEAISYNDKALILYDSIQSSLHQEEINDILKEHALTIAHQEQKKLQNKHMAILSFCTLIGITGIIMLFMHTNNHNKNKHIELQHNLMKAIADRNEFIERFKNLSLTNENTQKMNERLQISLLELWQQTMLICTRLFQATDSFRKVIAIEKCKYIPDKQKKKEEIDFIRMEIKSTFAQTIQNLQESFPTLTQEDIIYCILSYLKLSISTIKICMQIESTAALTQRKYRIKKQLNQEVFNFIFNPINENIKP